LFNDGANYYDYAASMLDDEIWIRNTGATTLIGKPEVRGEQAVVPVPRVYQNFFIDCLYNMVLPSKHKRHITHTQLCVRKHANYSSEN